MRTFYYKWTNKKTGEIIMANFGWAETFDAIKDRDESRLIACEEISREEFASLRAMGK